jgi:hypothetical protein
VLIPREVSHLSSVQTAIQWVKLQEREADHTLPTSADVKKEWSCNSIPSYALMADTVTQKLIALRLLRTLPLDSIIMLY